MLASDAPPERGDRDGFGRIAGEFGVRQYQAVHEWAVWALDRIAADAVHHPTAVS